MACTQILRHRWGPEFSFLSSASYTLWVAKQPSFLFSLLPCTYIPSLSPGVLERRGNKVEINLPWTGQILFFAFKIPEIYWEYSTKRVLTMEFCEGGKVDDLPYMQSFKISSDEASKNLKILKLFSCLDLMFGKVSCKSTIYT